MIPCGCWDGAGDRVSTPVIPAPSPSVSLTLIPSPATPSPTPFRRYRPSIPSPSPSQQPQGIIVSFDLFYVVFGLSLCFREMGCWFCLFSVSYVLFFFLGCNVELRFFEQKWWADSQFYWTRFLYIEIEFNKLGFYIETEFVKLGFCTQKLSSLNSISMYRNRVQ